MMEVAELVNLIMNNGVTVVILAYALWVNTKYLEESKRTMSSVKDILEKIDEFLNKKG